MRKLISFGALVALLVGLMAAPVGAVQPRTSTARAVGTPRWWPTIPSSTT